MRQCSCSPVRFLNFKLLCPMVRPIVCLKRLPAFTCCQKSFMCIGQVEVAFICARTVVCQSNLPQCSSNAYATLAVREPQYDGPRRFVQVTHVARPGTQKHTVCVLHGQRQ